MNYITQTVGATALFVNPVFSAYHNAGYGQFDYHTVNPFLGNNKELSQLVGSAHSNDLKVVMDGVYLYSLYDSKWVDANSRFPGVGAAESFSSVFHDRFYWSGSVADPTKLPFGQPKLNWASSSLKSDVFGSTNSAMQTFLRAPYNIDGWRLDVPAYNDATTDGLEIERQMRTAVKSVNPNAILMGELGYSEDEYNGDTLDSRWNYDRFTNPLIQYLQGAKTTSQWASQMNASIADIPRPFAEAQYNMLGTHDTKRILRELGENTDLERLAMLYQMTYVGAPVVYYGDEIGYSSDGPYDSMQSFDWSQDRWNNDTFNFYRSLIDLRKQAPALVSGAYKNLLADNSNKVLAYARWTDTNKVVVATNTDTAVHSIVLDVGQTSVADGTVMRDWLSGKSYTVVAGKVTVALQGRGAVALVANSAASNIGGFRSEWQTTAIGTPAGGDTIRNSSTSLLASGTGSFTGTADTARLAHRPAFGDFSLQARVDSISASSSSGALVVRSGTNADAQSYAVTLTQSGDVKVSSRSAVAGATTTTPSVHVGTAPRWLKIVRTDNVFTAFQAPDVSGAAGSWTAVPAGQVSIGMPNAVKYGVTSLDSSPTPATVSFSSLAATTGSPRLADTFDGSVVGSMWTPLGSSSAASTASGSAHVTSPVGEEFTLGTSTPVQDWSARLSIAAVTAKAGSENGLISRQDAQNSIRVARAYVSGAWRLRVVTVEGGTQTVRQDIPDPTSGGALQLQLNRVGAYYSSIYSSGGTVWNELGSTPVQLNLSSPKVGPYVSAVAASSAVTADFASFAFGNCDSSCSTLSLASSMGSVPVAFVQPQQVAWTYGTGTWTDIGNGYRQQNAGSANATMRLVGKTYGDLKFDLMVDMSAAASGSAGLRLRTATESDETGSTGYEIRLAKDGTLTVLKAGVAISGATNIATGAAMTAPVRMSGTMEAGILRVFINANASPTVSISDSSYTSGYVSVVSHSADASFDNIAVYPLNASLQQFSSRWTATTGGFTSGEAGMMSVAGRDFTNFALTTNVKFGSAATSTAQGGILMRSNLGQKKENGGIALTVSRNGTITLSDKGTVLATASSGLDFISAPVKIELKVSGSHVGVYLAGSVIPLIDQTVTMSSNGALSFFTTSTDVSFTGNSLDGVAAL